jgi:uncharacterized protein (TIGR02246 family)
MIAMRGVVVVSIVAAFLGGYLAQGQNREKPADPAKKGSAAGTAAPQTAPKSDAGKKPAETAKKPVETAQPAGARPAEDPEEKAIRAGAEEFTKLYNAHNAKGLAALFSPKAEMIDEDTNVVKGREAIEKAFVTVFQQHPKTSMEVDVESVRVLTSMLAIEEGMARSKDSPDSPEETTVYVAIHVKNEGKWQLACVRDWDAPVDALTPHDLLERNLSWMLGEWIDESPDAVVRSVCKWHDNGNFLMQEFDVNVGGQVAMSGTQRIGWNAITKQFQSWIFDSHGGSSTGFWTRKGDRWIVKLQGATATGEAGSSTNFYRPVDGDTFAWGSFDRVIDGAPLEDIDEIIVKRRIPAPAE